MHFICLKVSQCFCDVINPYFNQMRVLDFHNSNGVPLDFNESNVTEKNCIRSKAQWGNHSHLAGVFAWHQN